MHHSSYSENTSTRVAIFGCGRGGNNVFSLFQASLVHDVIAYVDNNQALHGTLHNHTPVISPDILIAEIDKGNIDTIVIASQYRLEIKEQLIALGVPLTAIELAHGDMLEGLSLVYNPFPNNLHPTRFQIFEALQQGVADIAEVPGAIAEFGCGSGQTALKLVEAIQETQADRQLLLFDSFVGMPEATSDVDQANPRLQRGDWVKGNCYAVDARLMTELLVARQFHQYQLFEGWFEQTLPSLSTTQQLALVHLDCDLYQSTREVLDYVFRHQLLSPGAILLFDDWDCNGDDDSLGQRRAWQEIVECYQPAFEDIGSYAVVGFKKRFTGYRQ